MSSTEGIRKGHPQGVRLGNPSHRQTRMAARLERRGLAESPSATTTVIIGGIHRCSWGSCKDTPAAITGAWLAMAAHVGGVVALASELHVTRNTVYVWATTSRRPHPAIVEFVNAWARRRKLEEPWGSR